MFGEREQQGGWPNGRGAGEDEGEVQKAREGGWRYWQDRLPPVGGRIWNFMLTAVGAMEGIKPTSDTARLVFSAVPDGCREWRYVNQ